MARIEKTVFISYRRADRWPALAVFKDLTQHGYDVFIDYDGIASGDFERSIVDNILARAHFVVLLTPAALEQCDSPTDWLRREIETALESSRNIVPLLLDGFTFEAPIATQRLQGSLEPLRRYQALKVPDDYFDDAMNRLRSRYLAVAVETVVHPVSKYAQDVAEEQRAAASKATAHALAENGTTLRAVPPQPADSRIAAALPSDGQAEARFAKLGVRSRLAGAALAVVIAGLGWTVFNTKTEKAAVPSEPAAVLPDSKFTIPTDGPTDAAAQVALAQEYVSGQNGRAQDDAEAVKWYRKAAEQGHAPGQTHLGFMYAHGRGGLPKDDAEAVKWFRKAAAQGNAAGQMNIGVMYAHGRGGLPKDEAEAVKWYRKAAEQGHAGGQTNLGAMYEDGRGGLPKDEAEAIKWYRKAAAQGYTAAKTLLKRLGRTG